MGMRRRCFRYRLDPQGRKLVVTEAGESTDDLIRDMMDVLTSFCAGWQGRGGARNPALRAVSCARRPARSRTIEPGSDGEDR
jgi:putative resolvase